MQDEMSWDEVVDHIIRHGYAKTRAEAERQIRAKIKDGSLSPVGWAEAADKGPKQ